MDNRQQSIHHTQVAARSHHPMRNCHISTQELEEKLGDEICKLEQNYGQKVALNYLGKQKLLEDATTRILVSNLSDNQPRAVITCARHLAPDLVARGTKLAEDIRQIIEPNTREAIIRPLSHGYIDERSYVILPFYHEFSRWKVIRACQRLWLTRPLLQWLFEATRGAVNHHTTRKNSAISSFYANLIYLRQQPFLSPKQTEATDRAIGRLESKLWKPRHTFDHNDFWLGNVMLPTHTIFTWKTAFLLFLSTGMELIFMVTEFMIW